MIDTTPGGDVASLQYKGEAMDAIRIYATVEADGELRLANLPLKKGQRVELILLAEATQAQPEPTLTAQDLLNSELVGLWRDRTDLNDSPQYARQLREQAQRREPR